MGHKIFLTAPQSGKFDYLTRLKEECAKLAKTNTPVFLVYKGDMLTEGQQQRMKKLQTEIPNLSVLDYDDVERAMPDEFSGTYGQLDRFQPIITPTEITITKTQIHDAVKKSQKDFSFKRMAVQATIDSTRLVLIYNSGLMKEMAGLKNCEPGLIYRDFDVTLKAEQATDIETQNGFTSSLNCVTRFAEYYKELDERAIENQSPYRQQLKDFFDQQIFNFENLSKNLDIAARYYKGGNVSAQEQKHLGLIEETLQYYSGSKKNEAIFLKKFAHVDIENSFLAVDKDNAPIMANAMCEVFRQKEEFTPKIAFFQLDPYVAVKRHFRNNPWEISTLTNEISDLQNCLKVHQNYEVGNDLTWQENFHLAQEALKPATSVSSSAIKVVATSDIAQEIQKVSGSESEKKLPQKTSEAEISTESDDNELPTLIRPSKSPKNHSAKKAGKNNGKGCTIS